MELSRDKVKEIINDDWLLMDDCEGNKNCDVVKELARIALASLEAEAVAYIRSAHNPDGFCFADGIHPTHRHQRLPLSTLQDGCYWKVTPLYTAPPAPVSVPDEATPENIEILASTYAPRSITYQWDRDECNAAADSWNACRAAMLQGADGNSPVIPDGYCIMPLKLTADNGAKGALCGEFHVQYRIVCQSCVGEGCEDCNHTGGWDAEIPVSWDTIKRIHEAAVETCALPAAPQQEVK
ncbi:MULTISPECIES: hypothetical protein [unclassified Enterobacter cloacae complex]|uniref:hypothetical protein n=1 Tax=unclassified Enterobacter cloacae complex TaxID=2757714 RepID=UPI001876D66D|nr:MULTISPECIES: hypothetical protein [unclassified Enterobacter cloacae complex]MBE4946294.1 hypothetical protein [Enterobacter cloacae complex sp. P1B]MBE4971461.1 hypothetical protein [Enterobacter cloacae complex sp. P11RS]